MTTLALAQAVRALSPAGVNTHVGEVSGTSPLLPWIVLNTSVPDVRSRSDAATPHGRTARLLVTLAGATEDAVLILAQKVLDAYEGARPSAAGWSCSPMGQVGDVKIFPDDVLIGAVNRHVMVGKVTFEFTATTT